MSRAYLCVSVDTECDKGPASQGPESLVARTFDGVHVGLVERLQPLFASFGAKPTYLVSHDVLGDARCIDVLRTIESGCELGTQLSTERYELDRPALTELTDRFIRAFHHQPTSFRTDMLGVGTLGLLAELGYGVESSVREPAAPAQPYHPDPEAPEHRGGSPILEVPVTMRRRWLGWLEPRRLRPGETAGDALVRMSEDAIGDARRAAPGRPVVVHATLRSSELAALTLSRLRVLLAFAERESIAVIGLGDVPEVLGA